jgi:hypothetical protein
VRSIGSRTLLRLAHDRAQHWITHHAQRWITHHAQRWKRHPSQRYSAPLFNRMAYYAYGLGETQTKALWNSPPQTAQKLAKINGQW